MITAYCILHYGKIYLPYAIESIYDQVDRIVILYTETPSQGFSTDLKCPDTREELLEAVKPFKNKITWIDGRWGNEGDHTNAIFAHAGNSEWLWRFDQDEINPPGMVEEMIRQAKQTDCGLFQVPFVHFWRSFNTVCRDSQTPYRLIRICESDKAKILDSGNGKWVVYHFGYAQTDEYIKYKWSCIGHKPELRPDWFEEKWMKNAQEDVHPVSIGLWGKAEVFDKSRLPEVIKKHPYYEMGKIV